MKICLLAPLLAATALAQDNIGLKLFDQLDADSGRNANLVVSPVSAVIAMQMTQAGAVGTTRDELHMALGNLRPLRPAGGNDFDLDVANALFCHVASKLKPGFQQQLADDFSADIATVDFTDTEPARNTINQWVSEKTRDKIPNLLSPGSLSAMTRLVLVNALYFKAGWVFPFEVRNTRRELFTSLSGATREVDMMHLERQLSYAEIDDVQILQLPYRGGCVMNLFLPRTNDLDNPYFLIAKDMGQNLQPARVRLALPKFKLAWNGSLKKSLQSLGIRDAFTPQADFSNIFEGDSFFIDDVIQGTFIDVNETGTEAAAATAVIGVTSVRLPQGDVIDFKADHPFAFTLHDRDGTLLFIGVVREL